MRIVPFANDVSRIPARAANRPLENRHSKFSAMFRENTAASKQRHRGCDVTYEIRVFIRISLVLLSFVSSKSSASINSESLSIESHFSIIFPQCYASPIFKDILKDVSSYERINVDLKRFTTYKLFLILKYVRVIIRNIFINADVPNVKMFKRFLLLSRCR